MKKWIVSFAAGALFALPALSAFAGDDSNDKYSKNFNQSIMNQNITQDYFRGHEWFGDVYGAYIQGNGGYMRSGGGGGASIGYYFTKNFGIDVEGLTFDGGQTADTVNGANANLLFRLPIESIHLAPYAFIGGGENFTHIAEPFADAGAGVEYRFTQHWGIFTDGRYVDNQAMNSYEEARMGVRFSF